VKRGKFYIFGSGTLVFAVSRRTAFVVSNGTLLEGVRAWEVIGSGPMSASEAALRFPQYDVTSLKQQASRFKRIWRTEGGRRSTTPR